MRCGESPGERARDPKQNYSLSVPPPFFLARETTLNVILVRSDMICVFLLFVNADNRLLPKENMLF